MEQMPQITSEDIAEAQSLMHEENFMATIKKCNEKYLYWNKAKYHAGKFNPVTVWAALKITRNANAIPIKFYKYTFTYQVTSSIQKFLHEFDKKFGRDSNIDEDDRVHFMHNSLMEEAIASSQMEGASTTRKVAKEILRKSSKPKDRSEQMIINNFRTISYLADHKNDALTLENLLTVHALITKDTLDKKSSEGALRTDDNIVVADGITGSIAHIPPKQKELKQLMSALCNFFNDDTSNKSADSSKFIHPFVKAAVIHFMVSWCHPFVDGNGRTARALFYWYLLREGYDAVAYFSISRIIYRGKAKYERTFLYTELDGGDMTYFIKYSAEVMQKAQQEFEEYASRKYAEKDNLVKYIKRGLTERQAEILYIFEKNKNAVVTVKECENRFAVSNQTARSDLETLTKKGYITEVALNKRKAGFVLADDVRL